MRSSILILTVLVTALIAQHQDYDESFDTSNLKEPQPSWPIVINSVLADSTVLEGIINGPGNNNQRDGYRVQVLTTKEAEKAEELSQRLSSILTDSVYVTFEVPNYKVRVGNFNSRSAAEELQEEIQQLGYRSAWIIRTRIEPELQNQ